MSIDFCCFYRLICVSEMTYYVSSGTLKYSLTHLLTYGMHLYVHIDVVGALQMHYDDDYYSGGDGAHPL